jgi:hypothetical protein
MPWVSFKLGLFEWSEANPIEPARLSDLCEESLWHIEELTRSTRVFLDVLSESTEEKTSLVDDRLFHKWIVKYITKNSDALRESTLFQSAIMQNNELAWRLCSLLLSSLGKKDAIPESHDLPSPASPPVGTPSNK